MAVDQRILAPLEVFAADAAMNRLTGPIPYTSLEWDRKYYEPGQFTMQVPQGVFSPEWAYVCCSTRPEVGIVQKVEHSDGAGAYYGADVVTVSGFFLEETLNNLVFLVEEYALQAYELPRITASVPSAEKPALYKSGSRYLMKVESEAGEASYLDIATGKYVAYKADAGQKVNVLAGDGVAERKQSSKRSKRTWMGYYTTKHHSKGGAGLAVSWWDNDKKALATSTYRILGDKARGNVFYLDADGNVCWVPSALVQTEAGYSRRATAYERAAAAVQVWDSEGRTVTNEQAAKDMSMPVYRIVKGPWSLRTETGEVTGEVDNVQAVMAWARRAFGDMFAFDEPGFAGEVKQVDPSLQRMGDLFYDELRSVGASLRLVYDFELNQTVFQIWRGLDRTQDQHENRWAVFADTWGTVTGYSASFDISSYRNKCYVLYEYTKPRNMANPVVATTTVESDGTSKTTYSVPSATARGYRTVRLDDGLDDAEAYLDLRGDEPACNEGVEWDAELDYRPDNVPTAADYAAWEESMLAQGREELHDKYADVSEVNTNVSDIGGYITSWDLGDKVDFAISALGMSGTARITEACETYDKDGGTVEITIGERRMRSRRRTRFA